MKNNDVEEMFTFAKNAAIPRLGTFNEDYKNLVFYEHKPAIVLFTEENCSDY